jgi:CRP-like cAMP-binding protein
MTIPVADVAREARLVRGVIANLALFSGVAPGHVSTVARQSWALPVPRGAVIARRGSRLEGAFALAYGFVELALRDAHGVERGLRFVAPGQTFGEATALLGRACKYEAIALAESKLIVIPAAALFALMDHDARFARTLLMTLAQRELDLVAEIESATLHPAEQRLAGYLHSLADPGDCPAACTVRLPVSKTAIASRLDMKKETLSRLLRALVQRGLIAVKQREITLLDRARLKQIC